ncbi:LPS assembly lipoprotein LptE [Arcobacter sp.]|uniref:LPS assembly lipoprotein LptE n=1 Tax=Arcobacter sp. TaxID=1872629 RepID=UPI003D106440
MKLKSIVLAFLIGFLFTACGYKPGSYYAKKEINGNVFVDLRVNIEDPKNSVLIKDAMNELLVHKLDAKLVNKKELADTIAIVTLNSTSFTTLQYDADGYSKLYKATSSVNVHYTNEKQKIYRNFNVSGTYDFSIDNGGTISDAKRFEAIKIASTKALDEVISKIAVLSFEKPKKTLNKN